MHIVTKLISSGTCYRFWIWILRDVSHFLFYLSDTAVLCFLLYSHCICLMWWTWVRANFPFRNFILQHSSVPSNDTLTATQSPSKAKRTKSKQKRYVTYVCLSVCLSISVFVWTISLLICFAFATLFNPCLICVWSCSICIVFACYRSDVKPFSTISQSRAQQIMCSH